MSATATATRIALDKINRFASKAPQLEISSSDPVDTATGVAVSKTITLTFSTPLHPPSVDNTNITISPNVARTTALDSVNHRIVTIDPTSNLAASTSYTVTMTTGLRGLYGAWILTPTATDSISFTTA
jgi:methionine-rich copper-binding protein CopC